MAKKFFSGLTSLAIAGFFIYQMFFAYGSKINFGGGEEVYYKSGATEAEAQQVGETLKELQFFDGVGDASVQIEKREQGYAVRFVTVDGAWNDTGTKKLFARIGWSLSQRALQGEKVVVELCDDSFETKATIEMEESRLDETKVVDITPTENVYFRGEATEAEAKKLGKALQDVGFFTGAGDGSAQLEKQAGGYIVRLVTIDSAWSDTELHKEFQTAAWTISQDTFAGQPVVLELCDSLLETKVTLQMQQP